MQVAYILSRFEISSFCPCVLALTSLFRRRIVGNINLSIIVCFFPFQPGLTSRDELISWDRKEQGSISRWCMACRMDGRRCISTCLPTYIIHMLSDLQSISALVVYCSGGGQWPFPDKHWKGYAGDLLHLIKRCGVVFFLGLHMFPFWCPRIVTYTGWLYRGTGVSGTY